jgi:hypothetical protein
MMRFLFICILTALVLVFQNCSTGKHYTVEQIQKSVDLGKSNPGKVAPILIDLNTTSSIQVFNVRNTEALDPKDLLVKPDVYFYLIHTADGRIESYDVNNVKLKYAFCLTENDKIELRNILNTAQICEPTEAAKNELQDLVCAMEYTMPYAKLLFPHEKSFTLGEMTSSCDIPIDLCGDHSKLLQGFVKSILLNIKTRACQ